MSYKMRLSSGNCWCVMTRQSRLLVTIAFVVVSGSWLTTSVIGGSVGHRNSVLMPVPTKYNSLNNQEAFQRRLMREREVMPPMSNNVFPGEPSCEELRAMWRYYKRQSRAELTNEIPQFGSNLFWDILPVTQQQPQISSFGPVAKGRSKTGRLRVKTQKAPAVYGQVMVKPERERSRKPRPMEEVARLMGKGGGGGGGGGGNNNNRTGGSGKSSSGGEPIVHLSPPSTPTKESSLQKIKEVFREERIREKGPAMRPNDDNGKAFGRIILSPPRGMDGRVANKPRELMTPFEKIRFGHADDILDDELSSGRPNILLKRRTLPLLNNNNNINNRVTSFNRDARSFLPHPQEQEEETRYSSDFFWDYPQSSPSSSNDYQPFAVEVSDSPSCKEMEGQPCRVNSDCSCVGFGLYRCFANECQVLSLHPATGVVGEKSGTSGESSGESFWHSGPLDTNRLGLWEDSHISNVNSDAVETKSDEARQNSEVMRDGEFFENAEVTSGLSRVDSSVHK